MGRNAGGCGRIRLHMTDCTGSHGCFAAAELECEGPDSGALSCPEPSSIDSTPERGECGAHTFERYRITSPVGDASLRLETIARADFSYRPE